MNRFLDNKNDNKDDLKERKLVKGLMKISFNISKLFL